MNFKFWKKSGGGFISEPEKQDRTGWRKGDVIYRHNYTGGRYSLVYLQPATIIKLDSGSNVLAKDESCLFEISTTIHWGNKSLERRRLLEKWGLTEEDLK